MTPRKTVRARHLAIAVPAALALPLLTAVPAFAAPPVHAEAAATVANDTLTITGTNGPDRIGLDVGANPNTLLVTLGTQTQSFDRSTFNTINVFLGAGDDEFFGQGGATPINDNMTVYAGSGNDTVFTGAGNDVIFGGAGNDNIRSGAGDDLIFAGSGNDFVDGGTGHDTAFLGAGQDSFQWDPGDGSDVVDGGAGIDTLVFNGSNASERMSLAANGSHSVFLRDVGNIRMDMNRVEQLNLATLGGTDAVTINDMTGTGFRQANVDLSAPAAVAFGDSQASADVVTVNGTDQADHIRVAAADGSVAVQGLQTETSISGAEQTDQLQINARGGNDRVDVSPTATAIMGVGVDLGSGQR
jgi:hypothetical protein